MKVLAPELCIIGGGSGGLSLAAGAAQLGADVVLVERHKMGGDCLNYGCVPSKSLLAAAKAGASGSRAREFGLTVSGKPDYKKAQAHVRRVIASIAPHDSVARFTKLGVRVIQDEARFVSPREVRAGRHRIRARRFVIATGSHAFVPPIAGLGDVPYLTNETIFSLPRPPRHLIIIGGGPIGMEMAQAHGRLGIKVSVFEAAAVLGRDDPELTKVVVHELKREGVQIYAKRAIVGVEKMKNGVRIRAKNMRPVVGSHVLVAVGRRPSLQALDLDEARVAWSAHGVKVNARLRSSNRRVFAIGDAAGGLQFTHAASYQAGIVLRNILFRLRARADMRLIPHVTYTAPELAQLGPLEQELKDNGSLREVVRWKFADNDRARAEQMTQGLVKVCLGARGKILSVGIVGAQAGEMLFAWNLAMQNRLGLAAMAGTLAAYPTLSEASARAAGSYYARRLFAPRTRFLAGLWRGRLVRD